MYYIVRIKGLNIEVSPNQLKSNDRVILIVNKYDWFEMKSRYPVYTMTPEELWNVYENFKKMN